MVSPVGVALDLLQNLLAGQACAGRRKRRSGWAWNVDPK